MSKRIINAFCLKNQSTYIYNGFYNDGATMEKTTLLAAKRLSPKDKGTWYKVSSDHLSALWAVVYDVLASLNNNMLPQIYFRNQQVLKKSQPSLTDKCPCSISFPETEFCLSHTDSKHRWPNQPPEVSNLNDNQVVTWQKCSLAIILYDVSFIGSRSWTKGGLILLARQNV